MRRCPTLPILRFIPVVAVLVFLVPVPGEIRLRIALPLQNWTARIEQTIFEVLGTDVIRTGNQLMINGQPVNDDTVKNQIRNGSANMAAYRYTLSDADLDDLVAFLRDECCWDSDAPPLNPRYHAR